MKPLLIGEAASETDIANITAALRSSADVDSIIHLRTMHLGPDDLLVAAKVEFDHPCRSRLAGRSTTAEASCAPLCRRTRPIYIEPDIRRRADPMAHG